MTGSQGRRGSGKVGGDPFMVERVFPAHEDRAIVLSELHARPFQPVASPRQVFHFALMTDSAGADVAKLMFNAATLFLVPTSRSMRYTATFSVECRGEIVGKFSYEQMVKTTSFIGIDPTSNERNVIESVVSRLLRDLESEAGQDLTNCPELANWPAD